MRIGQVVEASIWMTGDEAPELRTRYEQDVRAAISELCTTEGFAHGPVTFMEKRPEDDRVPEAPDHIQGSRVRLLVAEAELVGMAVQTSKGSFVANLDKKDLSRLRTITRREALTVGKKLTDQELDEYLEQFGPEAAVEALRKNVGVSVH